MVMFGRGQVLTKKLFGIWARVDQALVAAILVSCFYQ